MIGIKLNLGGAKVERCPRCLRFHGGGVCGIPAGVTHGFGARVSSRSTAIRDQKKVLGKVKSTTILEGLLAQADIWYTEVMGLLKITPHEMPEYTELIARELKLSELISQVKGQIAVRK